MPLDDYEKQVAARNAKELAEARAQIAAKEAANNKLVLAAYPAMDAVDAIRKWCDGQKYENDTITVSRLREMLPLAAPARETK